MGRQRYIQQEDGTLLLVDDNYSPAPRPTYYIQGDIDPYRSMADGQMVMGRKQHREMLKRNNCFEVGNEVQKVKPVAPPSGLKETLIRVANEKLRS